MNTFRISAAVASLLLASASAGAASDYLLQLGGVKGEAATESPLQTIEVESFSWGASNAGVAAAKGGTGKVNVQDLSVMSSKAPRDAASGQATGRRAAAATTDAEPASRPAPTATPKVGDVATFTITAPVAESSAAPSSLRSADCAKGTHFPKAVVVGRGQRVELSDVVLTSCSVVDGVARKRFTGHVTLMR
jgi:hypothetical protein